MYLWKLSSVILRRGKRVEDIDVKGIETRVRGSRSLQRGHQLGMLGNSCNTGSGMSSRLKKMLWVEKKGKIQ